MRPRRKRGREIPGIDDGEPETARRHGMLLGLLILVEGDLHAGYARLARRFDEAEGGWR